MVTQNILPDEIRDRVIGIFNSIILNNQKPRMAYLKLLRTEVEDMSNTDVINEINEINQINESKSIPDEASKSKKKNKLPKHYGKEQILKDIETNNGKSELDAAMLALNDLRNIYSKLKHRCIKDKLRGTNNLTITDCRDIIAVVRIVQNKLNNIIEK
jgi:hypothetical protein